MKRKKVYNLFQINLIISVNAAILSVPILIVIAYIFDLQTVISVANIFTIAAIISAIFIAIIVIYLVITNLFTGMRNI